MKKIKSGRNTLCVLLVVCMTFFAGISTFSENNAASTQNSEITLKMSVERNKQYLEDAVIKLVQEGKLTKEKGEKILQFKQKKLEELSKLTKEQKKDMKKQYHKVSLLSELKQEGIITDAEAQMIRLKLHEMKEARLSDGMQGLVDKGVLTAKDIDNIRNYMVKAREERKIRIEKYKSMTPEERKKYFSEIKKGQKDIITRMVEDKVITEKQAEEIKRAVPELNRSRYKKSNQNSTRQ